MMGRTALILLLVPAAVVAELFTWDHPATYADGVTPFPLSELHEYRLYCGDTERPVMVITRQQTVAWVPFPIGSAQSCYVTARSQIGLESVPSNVQTFQSDPEGVARCFMARSAVTNLMFQHCNLWFE